MLRNSILFIFLVITTTVYSSPLYSELDGLSANALKGAQILDESRTSKERLQTALSLIRFDAEEGNAAANYVLGVIYSQEADRYGKFYDIIFDEYSDDYNDSPIDMAEMDYSIIRENRESYSTYRSDSAIYYYETAANKGYVPAMNNLGYLYSQYSFEEYRNKALFYYIKAAEAGSAAAYTNLGREYFWGGNLVDYDFNKAVTYLAKALELGDNTDETFLMLGYCYEKGLGVRQDYKKAIDIYTQAPDRSNIINILGGNVGNFSIPSRLGILFYSIDEVRDYDKAFKYLKAVADQVVREVGETRGYILRCLSACYRFGRGTAVDLEKADFYLKEAGEFGNIDAQKALEYLSME
ncbi:MAG: hypothetical protein K2M83_13755 [Muribaculaceae bacterium]|nr:hypothetical protein [Muribaculaceae bacterium]